MHTVLQILVALVAFYAAYIVGWLVYVGYLRWRGRGNNSIAVTEDGRVILERGGFIWQVIRFTHRFGRGWKSPARWDQTANLCPLGARFLYGLTIFPLVIFPIVAPFYFAITRIDRLISSPTKSEEAAMERFQQKITAFMAHPINRGMIWLGGWIRIGIIKLWGVIWRGLKIIRWPLGKFFRGIGQTLNWEVPAGPVLWAGRSWYTTPMKVAGLTLAALAWAFVVETVVGIIVTVTAMIIGGSLVLWWWETVLLGIWFWIAVIAMIAVVDNRVLQKWWENSRTVFFLKTWWEAKHGVLCPPVEFMGDAPPTAGGPNATPA